MHKFSGRVMLATNSYEPSRFMSTPRTPSSRILVLYYAATAVFLLLDYFVGLNVRLAFLESWPTARAAYYGVCFLCLALMIWRPAWTTLIGAFESLVTLVALILSMAIRTLLITDRVLETGTGYVTIEEILNFMLAGSIAYLSWIKGLSLLRDKLSR